jgi:hypothetical protein
VREEEKKKKKKGEKGRSLAVSWLLGIQAATHGGSF